MKKMLFVVFLSLVFIGGCNKRPTNPGRDTKTNTIIPYEYSDISFFFDGEEEIKIFIPLMIENKTSEVQFAGFKSTEIQNVTAEIYFEEEYKGISLGSVFVTFPAPLEEIAVDTIFLRIDEEIVEYKFGKLYSKKKTNQRAADRLFVFNSVTVRAPLADFSSNLISLQAIQKAKLSNLIFSSDELDIVNQSLSDYLKVYSLNEKEDLQLQLQCKHNMFYCFDTCIEGIDPETGEIVNEYALILTQNDKYKVMKQFIDEIEE